MEKFRVHHFSFGMNTSNADRGSVTLGKLAHFLRQLKRLHRFLIRHQPEKGRKILLHLRGGNFRRFYNGQPPWVRRVIRSNLRQGDKVLVQSECLTDMFHRLVPNSRIGVLYNGLELKDLATQMSSSGQRNGKVVFFLGQLSYAKGYFDLLLAIPKIASQVDNLRVFLAGEHIPLSAERNIHLHYISNPETRSETVRQAKKIEQDYSDVIRYVGVIDAATRKKIMARTDVFVLPTYSEGFSNAVLEAMGCGLPVITTPVGAHPDIFRETPEVLVPPGDHERLAQTIVHLLNDKALRTRYGSTNREQVLRRYNMDHVAAQFVQAVDSVM